MATRQAACQSCRRSKLACDHRLPCSRCQAAGRELLCAYRDSPFKRRRTSPPTGNGSRPGESMGGGESRENRGSRERREKRERRERRESGDNTTPTTPSFIPARHAYPNPGYLGYSSHVTIFDHLSSDATRTQARTSLTGTSGMSGMSAGASPALSVRAAAGGRPDSAARPDLAASEPELELIDSSLVQRGADLVRRFALTHDMDALCTLISFWRARDINLALSEDFVDTITKTMRRLRPNASSSSTSSPSTDSWCLAQSRLLYRNSTRPLDASQATSVDRFAAAFTADRVRWETVSLFFSAVARATIDVPFYPPLYRDVAGVLAVRQFAAETSSLCLDLCLALDCMNDLQLMVQYENFIVHSCVDGDQSYRSWRKLGDVISSVYALGYHQKMEPDAQNPPFIVELRRSAFSFTFAADKNVSIFLGRPPRMSQRFCVFQTALLCADAPVHVWRPDTPIGYKAEMRWAALCSFLKEQIAELLSEKRSGDLVHKANDIRRRAMEQWDALPASFKLETSLKQATESPFGRDFLVSVRLNHLHVLFLLHMLLLDRLSDPDDAIIHVSQSMLAIVLEAVLLRDQLANSGTGLVWKVVCFGIPAVGVILLAMLRRHRPWQARMLQTLSVFVAEIDMGGLVKEKEPNYALLSQATQTIKAFLMPPVASASPSASAAVSMSCDPASSSLAADGPMGPPPPFPLLPLRAQGSVDFVSPHADSLNFFDFEIGFWQDLQDYSSFLDSGS